MMHHYSKILSDHFYSWEEKYRGHKIYNTTIPVAPKFDPFDHRQHNLSNFDDGRRPSTFQTIAAFTKQIFSKPTENITIEEVETIDFRTDLPLTVYGVFLPEESKYRIEELQLLLAMFMQCRYPLSFEIVATATTIHLQFTVREPDSPYLFSQIKAHFPETIVQHKNDFIQEIKAGESKLSILDLGIKQEFMRPIAMINTIEPDPFIGFFAVMEQLRDNEMAIVQVLFKGVDNHPWAENILKSVTNHKGEPFFQEAIDMLPAVKQKLLYPLFGANIRVVAQTNSMQRSKYITFNIGNILIQLSSSPTNSLTLLSNENYSKEDHLDDVVTRHTRRAPMILNSRELIGFIHFPHKINSLKYNSQTRKTKAAPPLTEGHDLLIGVNEHNGIKKAVSLNNTLRCRHMIITGSSGMGKSNLLKNMALSDADKGYGFCIIEPHGTLVDEVLSYLPQKRIKDVILFSLSDSNYPISFNILDTHNDVEKEVLCSDLIASFRKQSYSWGDGLNSIFANAISTIVHSKTGGTLSDLRRFLIDKNYRNTFLKAVDDPNLIFYWEKEFPLLRTSSIGSILTRLDTFLRPKVIRNIVCQKQSLDFGHILNNKKILLVKLQNGLVGAENAHLLGTLVVSKILQATLARQGSQNSSEFYLYIDEFQNYLTESMAHILEAARKFNLSLILAHQSSSQLSGHSEIAESIIANCATRVCFRLGETDAKKLSEGFSYFNAKDFQNLSTGEAIVKVERSEFDFSLKTCLLEKEKNNESIIKEAIENSRNLYCNSKEEVERELLQTLGDSATSYLKIHSASPIPILSEMRSEFSPKSVTTKEKNKTSIVTAKSQIESDHRYLQNRIKQVAEMFGYKTTIEAPTIGKGRVDVLLEKDHKTIAIEISVATDTSWEIHNIKKCLENHYDLIISCHSDTQSVLAMQEKINETFRNADLEKIRVLTPEKLYQYLGEHLKENEVIKTIKGYKVNVEYGNSGSGLKRQSIVKILAETSLKTKH